MSTYEREVQLFQFLLYLPNHDKENAWIEQQRSARKEKYQ